MSEYKQRKPKVTGVPSVPKSVNRELQNYLRSLSELIETKVGIRGNALDRHVTLRELQDAGVVDRIDSAKNFNVNAVNAQNRGFTNTGTLRMFKSQLSPVFESSTHEFKHGLGRIPDIIQAYMHCTKADDTYKVGDVICITANINMAGTSASSGSNEGITILADATKLEAYTGDNGWGFVIERDGTGQSDDLGSGDTTLASSGWSLEIKAFVFETSTQGN
jgi:hypothetical protein